MALRPDRNQTRADQLAERKAAQDDVFLREVDDALRQDEMLGLWQRQGKLALAVVATGLLGLAGYLWWDSSSKQAASERGEAITKAIDRLEAQRPAEADRLLVPLAGEADDGSGVTAKLLRAGIALEQRKPDQAARLYAEVAGDKDAPAPFRDLATVRQVALGFDTMKPEVVIAKMKPLAVPGNPWFGSAGELLGMAWLKQGRNDLAGPLFASMARDKDVPESLKRRARQMAGVLGVDAIDDVAKAAAGDPPEEPAAPPAQ